MERPSRRGKLFVTVGLPGSGKTSRAKELATEWAAVRLTPDDWMIPLFDHNDENRAYWATEFVAWLTSAEIDVRYNLALGNLPLRSSEENTPEFAAYEKQYPGADVMFDNMANATEVKPTVTGYVALSRYVGTAVSEVLQGAAQPQEALDEAAQKSDQALANN